MTLQRSLLLTAGLFCAVSALADTVDTVGFTTVAFPNIMEQSPLGFEFTYLEAANTVPTGIDDNGQIVGQFQSVNCCGVSGHPILGDLGFVLSNGSYNAFYAVAADGQIVICMYCGTGHGGDSPGVYATGINDSGTIVGTYPDGIFDINGFTIPDNFSGVFPDPLDLTSIIYPGSQQIGYSATFINGINDSGDIVGNYADYLNNVYGGFLLNGSGFTPLSFTPLAINNLGQILGENGNGQVIVDTNGNIQNLGFLPFTPTGFNDTGAIVGGNYLYLNGNLTQIQLQGQTGAQVQINAINDSGEFVGTYTGSDGELGFAAATPEPGALGVLLAGLCLAAIYRRQRGFRFRTAS